MSLKRPRENVVPEYMRLRDAMTVFGMGENKLVELAKKCGAYYKIDRIVLINYSTMKDFIEKFRK
jgi:hypothetical protein